MKIELNFTSMQYHLGEMQSQNKIAISKRSTRAVMVNLDRSIRRYAKNNVSVYEESRETATEKERISSKIANSMGLFEISLSEKKPLFRFAYLAGIFITISKHCENLSIRCYE